MNSRDEIYPNVAIKTAAYVSETTSGKWAWVMTVHIEGPDDILSKTGPEMDSKQDATMDMLRQYDRVMGKLYKELSQ